MFEVGVSKRSAHLRNPVMHIIVFDPYGWETWCGGGEALSAEHLVVSHPRRCAKCRDLARKELDLKFPTPDEVEILRRFLTGDLASTTPGPEENR
jgi:hypothetical protein